MDPENIQLDQSALEKFLMMEASDDGAAPAKKQASTSSYKSNSSVTPSKTTSVASPATKTSSIAIPASTSTTSSPALKSTSPTSNTFGAKSPQATSSFTKGPSSFTGSAIKPTSSPTPATPATKPVSSPSSTSTSAVKSSPFVVAAASTSAVKTNSSSTSNVKPFASTSTTSTSAIKTSTTTTGTNSTSNVKPFASTSSAQSTSVVKSSPAVTSTSNVKTTTSSTPSASAVKSSPFMAATNLKPPTVTRSQSTSAVKTNPTATWLARKQEDGEYAKKREEELKKKREEEEQKKRKEEAERAKRVEEERRKKEEQAKKDPKKAKEQALKREILYSRIGSANNLFAGAPYGAPYGAYNAAPVAAPVTVAPAPTAAPVAAAPVAAATPVAAASVVAAPVASAPVASAPVAVAPAPVSAPAPPPPPRFEGVVDDTHLWFIDFEDIELEESIGAGAFGKVFRGLYFGTDVAVKMLHKPTDLEIEKYIERELSVLRGIRHPNIVQFLGLCRHGTDLYLVTEFISDGDLRTLLEDESKALAWRVRVKMVEDIARSLAHMHSKRVLHRDIKTENLLVGENYRLKLCDFGFARYYNEDKVEKSKRRPLSICGTDEYMAPEVILGMDYGEPADVYSFGIVLCEILCRRKPDSDFMARTPMNSFELEFSEVRGAVPEDCPPKLLELAEKCIDYTPENRPTFHQILIALKDIFENLPVDDPGILLLSQIRSFRTNNLKKTSTNTATPKPTAVLSDIQNFSKTQLKNAPTRTDSFNSLESDKLVEHLMLMLDAANEEKETMRATIKSLEAEVKSLKQKLQQHNIS